MIKSIIIETDYSNDVFTKDNRAEHLWFVHNRNGKLFRFQKHKQQISDSVWVLNLWQKECSKRMYENLRYLKAVIKDASNIKKKTLKHESCYIKDSNNPIRYLTYLTHSTLAAETSIRLKPDDVFLSEEWQNLSHYIAEAKFQKAY